MAEMPNPKAVDTGGAAFARPSSIDHTSGDLLDGNRTVTEQGGMTLRDYFAAAALTGLCGGPGMPSDLPTYAERAYSIADALIAERNRERQGGER